MWAFLFSSPLLRVSFLLRRVPLIFLVADLDLLSVFYTECCPFFSWCFAPGSVARACSRGVILRVSADLSLGMRSLSLSFYRRSRSRSLSLSLSFMLPFLFLRVRSGQQAHAHTHTDAHWRVSFLVLFCLCLYFLCVPPRLTVSPVLVLCVVRGVFPGSIALCVFCMCCFWGFSEARSGVWPPRRLAFLILLLFRFPRFLFALFLFEPRICVVHEGHPHGAPTTHTLRSRHGLSISFSVSSFYFVLSLSLSLSLYVFLLHSIPSTHDRAGTGWEVGFLHEFPRHSSDSPDLVIRRSSHAIQYVIVYACAFAHTCWCLCMCAKANWSAMQEVRKRFGGDC